MTWKRIERVQTPDALFLRGTEDELTPVLDHVCALPKKSVLYSDLELAQGQSFDEDWFVVFGADPHNDLNKNQNIILPKLENALSLYTFEPGCWFPVGVGLDMPEHVQSVFVESIRNQHDLPAVPLVIIPKFTPADNTTIAADVYQIKQRLQLSRLVAPPRKNAAKGKTPKGNA